MVFSSFTFLFHFLPAFLILYFLAPSAWKNAVIFLASLIFYFYGVKEHPFYLVLMLISILVNYTAARLMTGCRTRRTRSVWLAAGLTWNLGCLFVFKYLDFLTENINRLSERLGTGAGLPYAELVLPVGISFYTFQISSYLIDVYRKSVRAERSFLTLGTYLCMFPQLIAGPIVTYSHVEKQLRERTHSFRNLEEGLREFTIGLSLKVLIANQVGNLWTQVNSIGYESISCPLAWMGLLAYTFQIYFDFYGYSLMAKGLGRIMGFDFPDNFQNPYLSRSMTEFWRRWHMTLGSWFREYVYIPLGGNRIHTYRNLFLVWMLTGLWHGANWNFVLWGFFVFVLIMVEKRGFLKILEKFPALGHLYMFLVIPLSWLIFAVPDLGQTGLYLGRLFPFFGPAEGTVFHGDFIKYGTAYLGSMAAAFLCCTGIPGKLYQAKKYTLPMTCGLVVLFWWCVYCMYLGLDDPFLYYQF
ncbi:MAG: MBOAT family protein [Lachnospiraceae bacterium]|nr:MBOAT family protein [Lachnospiraceae bacterium]